MENAQQAHYQRVLEVSQRMLAAGMAQNWEQLLELEKQRQSLLQTPPPQTTGTPTALLVELIQQIQHSDGVLQEKLEAWLAHARILLRMPTENTP